MDTSAMAGEDSAVWHGDFDGPVRVGSYDHKELFCRMLLDTYDPYKPAVIDWPRLDEAAWARLTGLPFWHIAVTTEGYAAACMSAMADASEDPLIKQAIALNAFEERRHKEVLENMIRFYGIEIDAEPPYPTPPDAEKAYLKTGYGECFDSFFAFGLFRLAKESGFFPPDLVEVFEPIIQEEARHILFFVNWRAYVRASKPAMASLKFTAQSAYSVYHRAKSRLRLARADNNNNSNMTMKGHENMGIKIKPRAFMELCLAENERRMARYDPRLLRPQVVPRLIGMACPFLGPK
ncbi:MAG: ferritin-like domain-containing protein [Rhodospirillales bacterium]